MKPETSRRLLLYTVFFFSGAAGLSYEIVWSRLLRYSFGSTVYAVTTVLATFMGGLALGSFAFGRLADRVKRPLQLYAVLELGVGISCLAVPFFLGVAREAYLSLYPALQDRTLLKTLLEFALAAALLLVPTTLMGGTLPAVVRGTVRRTGIVGESVALLYGINTVGAAAGAAAAGYWLLPALGLSATNHLGVAINLAAGLLVLAFFRDRSPTQRHESDVPAPTRERSTLDTTLLAGFFVSGATAMIYQIAWVRALVLVIGSSTYAFSAILVTFLVGLALGSLAFKRLARLATPRGFAFLQAGIALFALLLIPFFNVLPRLFLLLFKGYEGGFGHVVFMQFAVVFPFVLAPTVLMGMTYPCVTGILSRDPERAGRDVGRFSAWNTAGAIAGSVGAGFFLIPGVGAQWTLAAAIALNLLVAGAVLWVALPARRMILLPACLAGAALPFLLPSWDRGLMSSGVSVYARPYLARERATGEDVFGSLDEVLFFREGVNTTIAVTRQSGGLLSLRVNGKTDAGTGLADMPSQVNSAFIPLALHPSPGRVGIVGLGSGITAGVATLFDEVRNVEVVEIEPAVAEAARFFSTENFGVLASPKVSLVTDDARSHFQGAPGSFDVIISEPSNPWIAGVASLFSAEFMTIARDKLAPGGIFCQWLQSYNISPEETRMVVRTFLSVFPDASLWIGTPGDFFLVGRRDGAGPLDAAALMKRLGREVSLQNALTGIGLDPAENLWSSFRLGPREMRAYGGDGPLNTDDRLALEYLAPRSLYADRAAVIGNDVLARKTANHPPFVAAPFLEEAAADLNLGKYLLIRRKLAREAAWHFARVAPLPPFGDGARETGAAALSLSAGPYSEGFESGTPLLLPLAGPFRIEEGEGQGHFTWRAYALLFSRVSGIVPGAGRGGGAGLVVRGLEGLASAGVAIPLAVMPSTTYEVSFWMESQLGAGAAVAGVAEFDAADHSGMQPTSRFLREHLLRWHAGLRLEAERHPWKRYRFSYETSPRASLLQLVFTREGSPDPAPVLIDDIEVKRAGA